jgi:hypothetical protein
MNSHSTMAHNCQCGAHVTYGVPPQCTSCDLCNTVPSAFGIFLKPVTHMYERLPVPTEEGMKHDLVCRWCKESKLIIDGGMNEFIEKVVK